MADHTEVEIPEPSQLTMVIATYNERETLPKLIEEIWQRLPDCQILVVDDNSPDGTGKWVRQMAEKQTNLRLLHRENERGLGTATLAGICKAMECEGTGWIGTMDADLSHSPADLSKLWESIRHHGDTSSVSIGSRYAPDGRIDNWPWTRRILSRVVNTYCRWILRIPATDCTSALRIYTKSALSTLDLGQIDATGYAYLEQILMHLKRRSQFIEVPIVFTDRSSGSSKANWSVVMRASMDLIRMGLRRR